MSGHSKWAQIKRKKAVTDKKRGKVFGKLAKQITIAARSGKNLDLAIETAKAANMPKDNIDRAIERGSGASSEGQLEEVEYEVYGPGGVAIIVCTITDNRNRAIGELRAVLNKLGGQIASMGSVKFLFEQRGVIAISSESSRGLEEIELDLIDAGADDIKTDHESIVVYVSPGNLNIAKSEIESRGYKVESATIDYIAKDEVEIPENHKDKVLKLLEAIDDLDDVDEVYTNANL